MTKLVLPGQQISIQLKTGEIDATWYERLRIMLDHLNSVTGGTPGAMVTLTGDVTGFGPTGTVPTTTVKLQGHAISSTAPTLNQVLEWTGSAWTPSTLVTTLIGDVTGTGTGTIATNVGALQSYAVSSTAPTSNQVLEWTGSAWTPTTLNYGLMTWVPYTTLGQAFVTQNLTRDGDWTMVANTNTTTRPAPQPSGPEEDLLPTWTPTRQQASGSLIVYNEWTVNTGGWINQYGVDVIQQNTGISHALTLSINGSVRDTFTAIANNVGIYWHDITPIAVASGAVLRVSLQISSTGTNSWYQQTGLFATPPTYCSLARGSLNGAIAGTTAYNCHLLFTPGMASPDWDIVAFGGEAGGGGGGGPDLVGAWTLEGNPTGSTTAPTAFTIGSLTAKTTPVSTDQLLLQDNAAAGALKSVPWSSLPSGGGAGGVGGPYTVSTLPPGTIGQMAYVTDGASAQAWASTIVGGGTFIYLVWFNGANWTVVGNGGFSMGHATYYIYGF